MDAPLHTRGTTGVGSNTSFKALPLACLAGLLVGLTVGFIIYYGGGSIKDLKVFFIISTVMLFFIAAGQVRRQPLCGALALFVSVCV
jgi:high-affinity Fe2+/Pb2+ permease